MKTDLVDGVFTITLDRPEKLNALDAHELRALAGAVDSASLDPEVRVIAMRGQGRAFCSGIDLAREGESPTESIDEVNVLILAMTSSSKPIVTLARGIVAGVGVSIALAGDLVLCDEDSYFLLAFTRVGLMPDGGATALLPAAIGRARAMRMALLAEKLPAPEALAAGLVTHVFVADAYDAKAEAVVRQLRSGPAVAFARAKGAINAATLGSLETSLRIEREGQSRLLAAADHVEGAAAFLARRPPVFSDR